MKKYFQRTHLIKRITLIIVSASALLALIMFYMLEIGIGDYEIALPNGYEIVRVSAGEYVIKSPGSLVIEHVKKYDVHGDVVIGYAEYPDGYFILNTLPDNIRTLEEVFEAEERYKIEHGQRDVDSSLFVLKDFPKGLEKDDWLNLLPRYGLVNKPRLHTPSRFDNLFR